VDRTELVQQVRKSSRKVKEKVGRYTITKQDLTGHTLDMKFCKLICEDVHPLIKIQRE